jgi:cell wall-associated NlpC family hydrolase
MTLVADVAESVDLVTSAFSKTLEALLLKCTGIKWGLLLAGTLLGGSLFSQTPAQASYQTMFAREGQLALQERQDATQSFERRVSRYKSVFVTKTAQGRARNVSLMFYQQAQTQKFNHYAKHWLNVRQLTNGQVYVYNDRTVYGPYLVAYHQLRKGHGTRVMAGKRSVRVHYSKANNVSFYYQKHRLTVHLKTSRVTLNSKTITAKHNRSFKGNVPTHGKRTTRLVADAKRYLGVPYRYAGRDAFGGLDCASFVNQVYLDVEQRDIGGMTGVQEKLGKHRAVSAARTGDRLFWRHPGDQYTYHVAMVIGHGQLIEEAGKSVHVSRIKARKPQFSIRMH